MNTEIRIRISGQLQVINASSSVCFFGFAAMKFELQTQVVNRICVAERIFVADFSSLVQIEQRHVKSLHAKFFRFFHDFLDLVHVPLENQIGDQWGIQHNFYRRRSPFSFFERDQALGNQRF